ncbi:thymidylate kinase [Actinoplanes cyaneus]|uniref:Thymidylate kinase n=1 Tax=Actinoplanes cyaneus TaxID=52696 RepID=A0A919IG18_9ACTN|nr:AAA family ATPase [Actinoplanes cyaneus]MCW2136338.1 thymidylate kinase [Actinoplanes cyaneus]GID64516.1 thymidylate kinase [Actinoplanes cyaneus]
MSSPVRTIALIGIDGSGKTTQARLLAAALAGEGRPAKYRQNAGGRAWFGHLATRFGRRDAEDLLGRRLMLTTESVLRWLAIARTLLRRGVRREIAVMDRFAFCQYASLRAHGAGPAVERLARLAYRLFPRPDVTFFLAVDPAVAQERIDRRGTDHESMDYLTAADRAYRSLPEFRDFVTIDANRTPDEIQTEIKTEIKSRFARTAVPAQRRVRVRTLVLAGVPVVAGAAVLGWQLAESF